MNMDQQRMIPNSEITIYNKYVDASTRTEKYQRSEIYDVVWQATKAVAGSKTGLLASNVATIFIPFAEGTQYVLPKAWQLLTTNRANYWTLQEGDVIVRNIVTDAISDSFTITALRAKYDDVVTITSVDAMDQGSHYMRHWQVGAK
jgi:hypothetical protein